VYNHVVDSALAAELDAAIVVEDLVHDICHLIEVPSVTGDETVAQHTFARLAERLGLDVEVHEEPLTALRSAGDYPGEEVARDRLVNVSAQLSGAVTAAPRLCISGHIDVVPAGERPWITPAFTADVRDGYIHGRGAADMKAGLVASMHAVAAAGRVLGRPPGDVVLHSVAAEEDGGLGALAMLRHDDEFAGCVIAEPTDGQVICAQAGALTWRGRITGRASHASTRLDGVSALDRFLPVYRALQELEVSLNRDVAHPLMRELALPYPLSVGRVRCGDWASSVPDELIFEGRVGVPMDMLPERVRELLEDVVRAAVDDRSAATIEWTGGQFAPAATNPAGRIVMVLRDAATETTGQVPALGGVPYGSDMRHYIARGVPTVLYGPGRLAQAHATDEAVAIDEALDHARVIARLVATFGSA
jgi:acetylornithine deacetylase